jgi:hypothetical protein
LCVVQVIKLKVQDEEDMEASKAVLGLLHDLAMPLDSLTKDRMASLPARLLAKV